MRAFLRAARVTAALLLVAATLAAPLAWLMWERADAYVQAGAVRLQAAADHFDRAVEAHRAYGAALPRDPSDAKDAFSRMRPHGEAAREEILSGAEAVREETLEALTIAGSLPALPLGPRSAGARAAAARGTTLYVEVAEAFEPLLDHLAFDAARAAVLADFLAYDPLRDLGDTPLSSPDEFAVRSAATAAQHRETERKLLDLSPPASLISGHHRLATAIGALADKALEARAAAERSDGPAADRALRDHGSAVAAAQQLALEQIVAQAKDPALARASDAGLALVRDALRQHREAVAATGPIEAVAALGLPRELWAAILGAIDLVLLGSLVALRRRSRRESAAASAPEADAPPTAAWPPYRSPAATEAAPAEMPAPTRLALAPSEDGDRERRLGLAPVLDRMHAAPLRVSGRRAELSIQRDEQLLRPAPLPFGRRADFVRAFSEQLKRFREHERLLRVMYERGLQEELSSVAIDSAFVEPIQDPWFLSIAFPEVPPAEWRELPTRDVYAVVESCLIANDLGEVALRLSGMRPPLDRRAPAWVAAPE